MHDPKIIYISFLLFLDNGRFIPLVGGGTGQGILVRICPPAARNKDFSPHLTWHASSKEKFLKMMSVLLAKKLLFSVKKSHLLKVSFYKSDFSKRVTSDRLYWSYIVILAGRSTAKTKGKVKG